MPTSEQLPLLNYSPGFTLIRGSAGSGKTTTAILRLRVVTGTWVRERERLDDDSPVRVLVLTYNKTLEGYIRELVSDKADGPNVQVTVSTFARWARSSNDPVDLVKSGAQRKKIESLAKDLDYEGSFLKDEVSYVLGRFLPSDLDDYANPEKPTYERTGRGASPRVDQTQRQRILDEVVRPYIVWKAERNEVDWEELAVTMALKSPADKYDIVIVDEAQDFSANQVRGVVNHLSDVHSTAFVLDAIQRIYPHGFASWTEAGVTINPQNSFRLRDNHRNTKRIAAFARPLIEGLPLDDDGTLPSLELCDRVGVKPRVVEGLFEDQMTWVIDLIQGIGEDESVGLLHVKGGGFFDYARARLREANIPFAEMQRTSVWPRGDEQVGLSTLHSAKGLEFDHVVILGLAGDQLPHGDEEEDAQRIKDRRLVAMAVSRARKSAAITHKPTEASDIIGYLDRSTYIQVNV